MNIVKRLAGVLTFITALGLAIAATRYLHVPFKTAVNVSRVATLSPPHTSTATDTGLVTQGITYQVKLVSLDFETRKSYTTLALRRETDRPAPEKLWLRTYFFVPGEAQASWSSETVEFHQPFKGDNAVTLTATGQCNWCGQSSAPGNGYYARVYLSTRSAGDVLRSGQQIDDDIKTAIPVLVQSGR